MDVHEFPPAYMLPPEYVAALNRVRLQLYPGLHGRRYDYLTGHGPAVTGTEDRDYAQAGAVVDGLSPGRGDVLAVESIGFDEDWSPFSFVEDLRYTAELSPYIDERIASQMIGHSASGALSSDAIPLDPYYYVRPAAVREFLAAARAYRIIYPQHYACGLAVAEGVGFAYADASRGELDAWRSNFSELMADLPLPVKYALKETFLDGDAEHWFRGGRMIHRLGSIATGMTVVDWADPPVLAYMVGIGHQRELELLLTTNRVSFISTAITPGCRARLRRNAVRGAVSSMLPFLVETVDQRDVRAWIVNVQHVARRSG